MLFTIVHRGEDRMLGHPPKAAARAERGQEMESQTESIKRFGSPHWTISATG